MDTLIIIGVLFCGVFTGYLLHAKGVQDGIKLSKGNEVAILPQPIKKARERKQEVKADEAEQALADSISNLMDYNGFSQTEGD